MRLAGKIALVTGGLSGIGDAVARRFAAEGARVIAADIATDADALDDAPIASHYVDVANEASVVALLSSIRAAHGRLDLLVNSAGIGRDIDFLDTPVVEFDRIVAVNLRGTFLVGQAAARLMAESGGGAIVNIASVSGRRGNVGRAAYGASKGGVVTLSEVMAVELAAHGIRVNIIAPGPVETPLVAAIHTPAIRAGWLRAVPLRRYGQPDEIAAAAVYLCSDEAAYVTGHTLAVDGGFLAGGLTRG